MKRLVVTVILSILILLSFGAEAREFAVRKESSMMTAHDYLATSPPSTR